MSQEEKKISQEEAIQVLREEEAKKMDECSNKINAILNEYGYKLDIVHNIQLVKRA